MTYFRILNIDSSVNVELMTDLIGFAGGSENFTVCQKKNLGVAVPPDAVTQAILNTFTREKHSVSEIVAYCNANNLKLEVIELTKVPVVVSAVIMAPTNLVGVVNSTTQVTLTWVKSSGATGYTVERATNVGFTTGLVAFNIGDLSTLAVAGLTTATQYWFRIRATNPFDVSNNSIVTTNTTS